MSNGSNPISGKEQNIKNTEKMREAEKKAAEVSSDQDAGIQGGGLNNDVSYEPPIQMLGLFWVEIVRVTCLAVRVMVVLLVGLLISLLEENH
jgi:hypothetical protein